MNIKNTNLDNWTQRIKIGLFVLFSLWRTTNKFPRNKNSKLLRLYTLIRFLRQSVSTLQQALGKTRHPWRNQWCCGKKDTFSLLERWRPEIPPAQEVDWDIEQGIGCQWGPWTTHMPTPRGSFLSFQTLTLLANLLKRKKKKKMRRASTYN